jgi:hypothetical protein
LQVQIGASIGQSRHTVLCDQDESRKKNRLNRSHHCQHNKRRVELWQWQPSEINRNPTTKDKQMEIDKEHTSRKLGDRIRYFVLKIASLFLLPLASKQALNIALNHMSHCRGF